MKVNSPEGDCDQDVNDVCCSGNSTSNVFMGEVANVSLPAYRDKRRGVKRECIANSASGPKRPRPTFNSNISPIVNINFVPTVHAGVLSKPHHEDGEVRTINENLSVINEFTAEDAPT